MPKPNYNFEKRQRELKKAKQQEEKRLKKLARNENPEAEPAAETNTDTTPEQTP